MRSLSYGPLLAACFMIASCDDGGAASTAKVEEAAKEKVRQSLGLTAESALFSKVFVGEPVNGDTVLCGVVQGKRADGSTVEPRRFIVATEPARWLKFGPVSNEVLPSQPDKFVEWHTTCTGEEEIR